METFLISLLQVALGVVYCDSQVYLPTTPYAVCEPNFLVFFFMYPGSFNNYFTGSEVLLNCLSFCPHDFAKCDLNLRHTLPVWILNGKTEELSALKMKSHLHWFEVSVNIGYNPYLTPGSLLFVILGNLANTVTHVKVLGLDKQQNLRLKICVNHY